MSTLQAEGQAMDADDWQPDEKTVRHCIEVAKDARRCCSSKAIVPRLEALLPKPDPAKALVEEFDALVDTEHSLDWSINAQTEAALVKYTRHLIETGRIKP